MGYTKDFKNLAKQSDLNTYQFGVINNRFLTVLQDVTLRYWLLTIAYYTMTNYVTAANIVVSALVGVTGFVGNGSETITSLTGNDKSVLWVCWAFSLSAAIINKMIYTLGIIDHKVVYTKLLHSLEAEGYMFLAGIQEYGDRSIAFRKFCQRVEEIIEMSNKSAMEIKPIDLAGLAGHAKDDSDSSAAISV